MRINWDLVWTILVALGLFALFQLLGKLLYLFIVWKVLVD